MSAHEIFWPSIPRDVVDVVGPDAETYVQSQVSQDIDPIVVGQRAWTFVLAPNGRVDGLAVVTKVDDGHVRLDIDAGFGDVLLARLARFKIRVAAELTLTSVTPEPATDEMELARIAAVWPAMGSEIVPGETIPAETGITDVAVSFTKGCYPGQELVERMDSRGATAPRLLQRVTVPAGTQVGGACMDGAGLVTSVQGTAALAYVKRSALAG